ncbi:hypothetical protein L6452_29867 [Arctium lappa]|uniref:Uncharacterized protein n=1 Tax=Arctium lappa TaxID=4217 RepID=A0ACB8ZHY4_ARCLA|nr:hypothetical protein L6452_47021 [Arctium lappa]KAI3697111.1 hypothetical protein L6452_29867 [Arctium lappa]
MVGVSLKCGDCGTLLKSVEEAQEHAELTTHTDFSKSTEAVLNLVCSTCGKPCRSKTESDLHTKRTGHTEFSDKTSETAKPIALEVPKKQSSDDMEMADASTTSEPEEMVVPDVDLKLLEELESMGFSKEREFFSDTNSTKKKSYGWAVSVGLCAALAAISAKFRVVLSPQPTPATLYLLKCCKWARIGELSKLEHVEVCPKPMDLTQNVAKRISTNGGGALIIDYGLDGIVSDNLHMGIFCMPSSSIIPRHNHPGMNAFSKLLYESMRAMHIDVCTYNAWIMLLYLCTLMFGKDISA